MKIQIIAAALLLLCAESECFSIDGKQRIQLPTSTNMKSQFQGQQPLMQKKENLTKQSKLKTMGQVLLDRSDTLHSAGFYDPAESEYPPLEAGAKTNITLFLVALGYKWYRSIFINKVSSC
jgi:hypothetical protein